MSMSWISTYGLKIEHRERERKREGGREQKKKEFEMFSWTADDGEII